MAICFLYKDQKDTNHTSLASSTLYPRITAVLNQSQVIISVPAPLCSSKCVLRSLQRFTRQTHCQIQVRLLLIVLHFPQSFIVVFSIGYYDLGFACMIWVFFFLLIMGILFQNFIHSTSVLFQFLEWFFLWNRCHVNI